MTSCTCVIESGEVKDACDVHRKLVIKTYNKAIEDAAQKVMFSCNDEWLMKKVRELRLSER